MKEIIELPIEKLAGLGDGMGMLGDRRIFVPCTIGGDVVRARIIKVTHDASYAALESIITPGPDRQAPVCRHFSICGGCTLQHVKPTVYNAFKFQMAQEAARKAGFDTSVVAPLISLPAASRRRVELTIARGMMGYHAQRSHTLVDISECKVLKPSLEALVLRLKESVVALPVTSMQINETDAGYDIVLEATQSCSIFINDWSGIARLSLRYKDRFETLHQTSAPAVTLGGIAVEVPPGVFMQASVEAQTLMTQLVEQGVGDAKTVLDLFCGIGTYSFPLARHAKVTAVEGDGQMIDAVKHAAHKNGLTEKLTAFKRDLMRDPMGAGQLANFEAVVINPPRAGAKAQCEAFGTAQVKRIVMVSCNPATFARDARLLKDRGYNLTRLTPVDQFVYSSHLELIGEFLANK